MLAGITGRNMPFAGDGRSLGGGRAPVDARAAALKVRQAVELSSDGRHVFCCYLSLSCFLFKVGPKVPLFGRLSWPPSGFLSRRKTTTTTNRVGIVRV